MTASLFILAIIVGTSLYCYTEKDFVCSQKSLGVIAISAILSALLVVFLVFGLVNDVPKSELSFLFLGFTISTLTGFTFASWKYFIFPLIEEIEPTTIETPPIKDDLDSKIDKIIQDNKK